MTTSWFFHERGRIGEGGKSLELSKKNSLRVGRNSDCDVVLQNQTVEPHHAEILWNPKTLTYMVRDLGSVNGTYVNNAPLRGSSTSLTHNDALRFGYDKDRVFRIEESCSSSRTHSTKQTSSAESVTPRPVSVTPPPAAQFLPVSTVAMPTAPCSHDLVGVVNGVGMVYNSAGSLPQHYQSVPIPLANQGYMYTTTSPLAPGINIVPSGGSMNHVPFRPFPVPPESHSYSSPFLHSSSPAPLCHHYQNSTPIQTTAVHSSSSSSSIEATPSDSTGNSTSSLHRGDGRRKINLENSPALNNASKLYGEPVWWGDDKDSGGHSKELECAFSKSQPGSRILRDIDSDTASKERERSATLSKLSIKDELRLQSLVGSPPTVNEPPSSPPSSSWTIDFGGGESTNTLPRMVRSREKLSRPRSADPSPNRLSRRRDGSPLPSKRPTTPNATPTTAIKRNLSLNIGKKKSNNLTTTPVSPSRRIRAATPPVISAPLSPSKKPLTTQETTGSSATQRSQRSATPPVKSASPARRRANTVVSSLYRSSPVTSSVKKGSKAAKARATKDSGQSGAGRENKSPTHSAHHQPLPSKMSPLKASSQSSSLSDRNSVIPSSGNGKSPTHEDAGESEGGENTYVVAASEDFSSLSSLSDPSFTSTSDSIVVVTPEASTKRKLLTSSSGRAGEDAGGGEGEGRSEEEQEEKQTTKSSGRKQWVEDDNQSCTDTLMMASIEARMRRLSQLAHQTARQATALKSTVQEGHPMMVQAVDYLSIRGSNPVMNKIEQSLPEWKSFNKEANSIFRNIRIVEKWLQDIDANLKCIQPADSAGSEATTDRHGNEAQEEVPLETST